MPSSQFILWIENRLSEPVGSYCCGSDTRLAEIHPPRPREGRGEEIEAVLRQLSERRLPGARTAERAGHAVEPPAGAEGARRGCGAGLLLLPANHRIIPKTSKSRGNFVLNLLLGWTFLSWVVALIWGCSAKEKKSDRL
jgi:hypothetical protein